MEKLRVNNKRDMYMIFGQYVQDNLKNRVDFDIIVLESVMLLDKVMNFKKNNFTKDVQTESLNIDKTN
jgi:hypothetical protein